MIDEIHRGGGLVKLHICGNINHIFSDVITTGADIVDIDHMVDFRKAVELADDHCAICGNINPVSPIYDGTPDEIKKQVKEIAAQSGKRGIISSGCEVPRGTPRENLMAITEALREIS